MLSLLKIIDQAYNLGYERQEKELSIRNAIARARIGDPKDLCFILGWKNKIREIDRNYENLGILEKLAFDFGNSYEI